MEIFYGAFGAVPWGGAAPADATPVIAWPGEAPVVSRPGEAPDATPVIAWPGAAPVMFVRAEPPVLPVCLAPGGPAPDGERTPPGLAPVMPVETPTGSSAGSPASPAGSPASPASPASPWFDDGTVVLPLRVAAPPAPPSPAGEMARPVWVDALPGARLSPGEINVLSRCGAAPDGRACRGGTRSRGERDAESA